MWTQFVLENVRFVINIFGMLSLFCIFWLHWDAWQGAKKIKTSFSFIGFLFLSISYLIQSTIIDSSFVSLSLINPNVVSNIVIIFKVAGAVSLVVYLIANPIAKRPVVNAFIVPFSLASVSMFLPAIAIFVVSLMYFYRSTFGLERHLRNISFAFLIMSIAEFFSVSTYFRDSSNVQIYQFVAPYGLAWVIQHTLLLVSFSIFIFWGFSYLLKRFENQLFIIFTTVVLMIFLLTTVSFTSLLLKNIQSNVTKSLESDAKILFSNLETRKAETLSDAQVVANGSQIIEMLNADDKKPLKDYLEKFLLGKRQSSLLVLNNTGIVVARAEDRDRIGDSLSSNTLVKRALLNQDVSSMTSSAGVLAPQMQVVAAVPIKSSDGEIQGVVMVSNLIDNAFVENISSASGMEVGIFGGDRLSATSIKPFLNSNERPIGVKESNSATIENVLAKGNPYSGAVRILNTSYLASYLPLKDIDNSVIGMLFVGSPESNLLQTASRSIEITFIFTAVMLIVSIIPSYLISRYIAKQV